MPALFLDLRTANEIWKEIDSHVEPSADEAKKQAQRKYEALQQNPVSSTGPLISVGGSSNGTFSAKELFLFVLDVVDFVHNAGEFYRELRNIRPLSARDKEVGQKLTGLLEEADQIAATLKEPPSQSAGESPKMNDWMSTTLPQERVG